MKQTLTRQRNALRTKLKGYLSMVVGDHAQKELDNDIFMEDEVIPEAPLGGSSSLLDLPQYRLPHSRCQGTQAFRPGIRPRGRDVLLLNSTKYSPK